MTDVADHDHNRCTAYHEAGHAVAAVVLGLRLEAVDLIGRPIPGRPLPTFGQAWVINWEHPSVASRGVEGLRDWAVVVACGAFGSSLFGPCPFLIGAAAGDFDQLRTVIARAIGLAGDPEAEARIRARFGPFALMKASFRLLNRNRTAVATVADLLLERQRLTGDEVAAIVRSQT